MKPVRQLPTARHRITGFEGLGRKMLPIWGLVVLLAILGLIFSSSG